MVKVYTVEILATINGAKSLNNRYRQSIMSLLQKIDSLFLESGLSIKIISGKNVEDQKYPTASFVSAGFCFVLLHTDSGLIGLGEPSPFRIYWP